MEVAVDQAVIFAGAKRCGLLAALFGPGVHAIDFFGHKPDYTGRSKLTEKLRITAGEALLTEGNVMFEAQVTGLSIRMIDTRRHDYLSCMVASPLRHWLEFAVGFSPRHPPQE